MPTHTTATLRRKGTLALAWASESIRFCGSSPAGPDGGRAVPAPASCVATRCPRS
jgi:hypothetical protein